MLKIIQSIGLGILGFMAPRILMGLGMPIDIWANAAGEYMGASQEWTAKWGLTIVALFLAVVLTAIEAWLGPAARLWTKIFSGNAPLPAKAFHLPESPGVDGSWVNLETASQNTYNELTSGRYNDAGQLRQALKALGSDTDSLWMSVSGWITDGIRNETIKARGTCERRNVLEPIPSSIQGHFDDNYSQGIVKDAEGLDWKIEEIDQSSLETYLQGLEE